MAKKTISGQELRDRILKNTTIKETTILTDSIIFEKKDVVPTIVPMINVALSGKVTGGLLPGSTMIAGQSKHFKTGFGLLLISSFLTKYPDGIVVFYDSEFGTTKQYFDTFNIPSASIVHCPVSTVEGLTTDILNQLNGIVRGDHVLMMIDSVGGLASLKELTDATAGKDKTDMTRAKRIKAMFRMITPMLPPKGIPLIAINHTYKTQETYSKDVTGGGTGPIYGANDIWIIGRRQDKDEKVLNGWDFIINVEKSRTVKEKSQIPISITWENGISRYSGLLDLAIEAGLVSQNGGYYVHNEQRYRRADLEHNSQFWEAMLKTDFVQYIEAKYNLPNGIVIEEVREEVA